MQSHQIQQECRTGCGWRVEVMTAMDFGQLNKFAARNGSVSMLDTTGQSRTLPSGEKDVFDLVEKADRFLWDGTWRSWHEMEELVSQSERDLEAGVHRL